MVLGLFSILDVGCGCRPGGSVNCDLHIRKTFHRSSFPIIDAHNVPNFVRCDALHLPFKNDSFNIVYSDSVIEHLDNPYLMLNEMIRVSSNRIEVHAPHRFYFRKWQTRKQHKHYFTKSWFAQLFKKSILVYSYEIKYERFPQMIKAIAWIKRSVCWF